MTKDLLKSMISPSLISPKIFFLFLTLLAGIVILYPTVDFQPLLSTGDHGRDLYCFKKTMEGALPYKDYWWVYGPLMPYYYGLFFKLFGVNIGSVLLGKVVLNLIAGLFFFLSLTFFMTPFFAFAGALWFLTYNKDFFFTYNHIGGTAILIAIIYFLFSYLQRPRNRYVYLGFGGIFLLAMIKINIGIFTLVGFIISLFIIDGTYRNLSKRKVKFLLLISGVTILLIMIMYWVLVSGLPLYVIRQCLIVLRADHPYQSSLLNSLKILWEDLFGRITITPQNTFFSLIIILSSIKTFSLLWKSKLESLRRIQLLCALLSLMIFSILNLHEFLDSGVYYRTFWIVPFKFMLIFIVITTAFQNLSPRVKRLLGFTLLFIIFLDNAGRYQSTQQIKDSTHYLYFHTARIFVKNDPGWIRTVIETTEYLAKTLDKNEIFFALPYDPLYYFLTDKDSPSRQFIFFDHINIKPEQEEEIIRRLEEKKVNYVLLSSRINTSEPELGYFGKTYCLLLAKYIADHFEVVATFGDWQNEGGWAWNHGTKILRRTELLN